MRVLVISPHPDDESIGCGGTLRQHALDGDRVTVLFLTSGEKGGHGRSEHETIELREKEAADAASILGIQSVDFWRLPDGAVMTSSDLVIRLRAEICRTKPDLLYVPHDSEMHPDHQAAARLVRYAIQHLAADKRPKVRMYEVWTPIQRIDEIVDISPFMDVKLAAVRTYKTQCEVLRFDEAVAGLNRYRGEMHSWPGGDYAEVFSELSLDAL